MHIMVLHVKLQLKRTKSVEMRAKPISLVKFPFFFNDFLKFFKFCPFLRHASMKLKNVVVPNKVDKYQNVLYIDTFSHQLDLIKVKFSF